MNSEDLDDWLSKVDAVSKAVSDLTTGKLDPNSNKFKALQAELVDDDTSHKPAAVAKSIPPQKKGTPGNGTGEKYDFYCPACHLEYLKAALDKPEEPTCNKCSKPMMTRTQRKTDLDAKVAELMAAKKLRQEKRILFNQWKDKRRVAQDASAGTDYSAWEFWEEASDEEEPIAPDSPEFRALEKDINERKERKRVARIQSEKLKEEGNAAVANKNWQLAIEKYSAAIDLVRDEKVYYCNRAQCYLQTGQWKLAVKDCSTVMDIWEFMERKTIFGEGTDARNRSLMVKAFIRRAAGYAGLGQFSEAVADIQSVLDFKFSTPKENTYSECTRLLARYKQQEQDKEQADKLQRLISAEATTSSELPSATTKGSADSAACCDHDQIPISQNTSGDLDFDKFIIATKAALSSIKALDTSALSSESATTLRTEASRILSSLTNANVEWARQANVLARSESLGTVAVTALHGVAVARKALDPSSGNAASQQASLLDATASVLVEVLREFCRSSPLGRQQLLSAQRALTTFALLFDLVPKINTASASSSPSSSPSASSSTTVSLGPTKAVADLTRLLLFVSEFPESRSLLFGARAPSAELAPFAQALIRRLPRNETKTVQKIPNVLWTICELCVGVLGNASLEANFRRCISSPSSASTSASASASAPHLLPFLSCFQLLDSSGVVVCPALTGRALTLITNLSTDPRFCAELLAVNDKALALLGQCIRSLLALIEQWQKLAADLKKAASAAGNEQRITEVGTDLASSLAKAIGAAMNLYAHNEAFSVLHSPADSADAQAPSGAGAGAGALVRSAANKPPGSTQTGKLDVELLNQLIRVAQSMFATALSSAAAAKRSANAHHSSAFMFLAQRILSLVSRVSTGPSVRTAVVASLHALTGICHTANGAISASVKDSESLAELAPLVGLREAVLRVVTQCTSFADSSACASAAAKALLAWKPAEDADGIKRGVLPVASVLLTAIETRCAQLGDTGAGNAALILSALATSEPASLSSFAATAVPLLLDLLKAPEPDSSTAIAITSAQAGALSSAPDADVASDTQRGENIEKLVSRLRGQHAAAQSNAAICCARMAVDSAALARIRELDGMQLLARFKPRN